MEIHSSNCALMPRELYLSRQSFLGEANAQNEHLVLNLSALNFPDAYHSICPANSNPGTSIIFTPGRT